MDFEVLKRLIVKNQNKIVLLMLDGLGGLPKGSEGLTELETAHHPNLNRLAKEGICGLHSPIGSGITPGSGPSHLAVFGYDPLEYQVGRGALAASGIGFDLQNGDIAARGNFCTIDESGTVTDRRAGRISTEINEQLCEKLNQIKIEGYEIFVETVKEHRFLLVIRGSGLDDKIDDTDPQQVGKKPFPARAINDKAGKTAEIVNEFIKQTRQILSDEHPANMVLLRGFAKRPQWPGFDEVFGLKAACIASYPMYRGLSKLVGMESLEGGEIEDEFKTLKENWENYDFFYLHIKATDSSGEDGDFDRKVKTIEQVDLLIPDLMSLDPAVVIVTGDHSTPAVMKQHSWHPVPVLIWSNFCRNDGVERFGERECVLGGLGPRIPAVELMPIALANAGRLEKFGA